MPPAAAVSLQSGVRMTPGWSETCGDRSRKRLASALANNIFASFELP